MSRRPTFGAPTLSDRLVGWISPRAAYNRMLYRAASSALSGYNGARRDRNATVSWRGISASADADTLPDLDVLRARSQDLVRNDPLAQSAISTKVVNVIGAGHMVRPELDQDRLGLSPDAAQAWEGRALDIWTDWAESPDADLKREQTFAAQEDLAYRSTLLDGDMMVLRRFKPRKNRLLATCFQAIPAGRISNPNWTSDTDKLTAGIEFDADGAPVAVHVADRFSIDRGYGGSPIWTRVPIYDSLGYRQLLHVHGTRWRPDMTRYAPMLAPVIESLKQRSRYTEAEIVAAVVSACFAIGTRSSDGELGAPVKNALDSASGHGSKPADINLTQPGMIIDLLEDEQIQSFEPGRPNPQFAPFIEAVAQEVGAGTDLPYELLMKKFQASYSASRAALEMAWQFFRVDRARHVSQFCRPVYATVIGEAVARGLLDAPGFFGDPLRRQAWLSATWMGPSRLTIDPSRDAVADEKYLDMGVTSRTAITAERFGRDYRDVQRRRQAEGSETETTQEGDS